MQDEERGERSHERGEELVGLSVCQRRSEVWSRRGLPEGSLHSGRGGGGGVTTEGGGGVGLRGSRVVTHLLLFFPGTADTAITAATSLGNRVR